MTQRTFRRIDVCVIGPRDGWHSGPIDKLVGSAALDDEHRELAPLYHLLPLVLRGMYERRWGRIIGISVNSNTAAPRMRTPSERPPHQRVAACRRRRLASGSHRQRDFAGTGRGDLQLGAGHRTVRPWRRLAGGVNVTAQDIGEGVATLCSEAGRFITGCEMTRGFH